MGSRIATFKTAGTAKILASLLIIVCVFGVFFIGRIDEKRTYTSPELARMDTVGEIDEGMTVVQRFTCTQNGLDRIQLQFATYARTNQSKVHIALRRKKQVIQEWEVEANQLKDISYYTLKLDRKLTGCKGKKLNLLITSDAEPGNGITIYTSRVEGESGLKRNAEVMADTSLCFKAVYRDSLSSLGSRHLFRFLLVVLAAVIVWLLSQRKADTMLPFFAIWIAMTVLHAASNPVFDIPDESNHFMRIYEITDGHILSEYSEELNAGGRELPFERSADFQNQLYVPDWYHYDEVKDQETLEERLFIKFSNTALYSPLSYLPQIAGVGLARLFTKRIYTLVFWGRLANWLAISLLVWFTLKLLPWGKEFYMMVLLAPMNLFEVFSLAPDGLVVALSAFIMAFVLQIRETRRKLTARDYVILYAAAVVMCSVKIVYLPFCMYYFLIPADSFRHGWKGKLIHAGICVALVGVISLGWMRMCSQFLVIPGTNPGMQTAWILSHPFTYLLILLRYLLEQGGALMMECIGSVLGWRNIVVPDTFILLYLAAMTVLVWKAVSIRVPGRAAGKKGPSEISIHKKSMQEERIQKGSASAGEPGKHSAFAGSTWRSFLDRHSVRLVSLVVALAVGFLTLTALYIQWNTPYALTLDGVQGRYFIALLMPFFFVIAKGGQREAELMSMPSQCCAMLVNICTCACILFRNI